MAGENAGGNAAAGQAAQAAGVEIEIGGEKRKLTAEDVKAMATKVAELEEARKKLEPFVQTLGRYGIDTEEYLRNSEASFVVMNQLIEKGVIDEQGNLVEKKGGQQAAPVPQVPNVDGSGKLPREMQVVLNALGKVTERLDTLEESQSVIYRRNLEADVQSKFSNLESEDVTKLLAKAKADRGKSLWEHAKVMSEEKEGRKAQEKTTLAKEVLGVLIKAGIVPEGKLDLEKLDLSALAKKDSKNDPPSYEGKKFLFSNRKKVLKDRGVDVSKFSNPADAMKELVGKRLFGN
jgi:hypothetical protein